MKIPLKWLNKYIEIKHTDEEFGQILTNLEFMQDGPVKDGVIDLEVRQNRPDALSIIGIAREYSAYINEPIKEPEKFRLDDSQIKWNKPDTILRVEDKDNVQRFTAVEINNIKIGDSPDWMKEDLESYGLPSINNVVDITNYVMLEYGIPLHAFDKSKLSTSEHTPLLTLRKADPKEEFKTWQGTNIRLTQQDTVVADSEKPVAIAGVIGGANSDIDSSTITIILEAACYNHASIRRTALRHQIRTEASSRHEKILNPRMIKESVLRAIFLIQTIAEGEVISIEDYFNEKNANYEIEFNINEISRLTGVNIEHEVVSDLLTRLGFKIIEHKEAIGINRDILLVQIPKWRSDILHEADLVEEVIRLNGYKNIPTTELSSVAPDFGTPKILILEEIVKDLLVNCGCNEQILSPLVRKNPEAEKQIEIENPLNSENQALRTSIKETLIPVVDYYKKAGHRKFALFELGKVYFKEKAGEYREEKQVEVVYEGYEYSEKIKPDFIYMLDKLGLNDTQTTWELKDDKLIYSYGETVIGILTFDGFVLFLENIIDLVDIYKLPFLRVRNTLTQKIIEDITLLVPESQLIGKIAETIKQSSDFIKQVNFKDIFVNKDDENSDSSVTLEVIFEDISNKLSREKIEEIRAELLNSIKKYQAKLKI